MVVDRDSVLVHHRLTEAMETWFTGDGRAGDSGGRDLAAEGSGSERGSNSSSLWVLLCGWMMGVGRR
jgi:hypothetical protein